MRAKGYSTEETAFINHNCNHNHHCRRRRQEQEDNSEAKHIDRHTRYQPDLNQIDRHTLY